MRGFCSKCIAWLVVFSFSITNHSFVSAQTVLSDKAGGYSEVIHKLEIPANLGTIETQFQASKESPFVVYIQDAHAIYDAQSRIEALIQFLRKKYGISLVALEGAEGPLDPLLLRAFPDKFTKRKVLDAYLTRGELTGPEMAAVFNPESAAYEGLENWKVYEENYLAYLEGIKQKDKILKRLTEVREMLDRERQTIYSAPMNAFHEQTQAFYDEKSDLMKLLKFLGEYKGELDPEKHADLMILMGSLEKSSREAPRADENLEGAVKKMAQGLRKKLSSRGEKDGVAELNKNAQDSMTGKMDAGAFLKYLVETGRKIGLRPKLTPRMREILGESETLSMIRGSKLFDELEDFLKAVETTLAPGPKEKELAGKYRKLRLLGALAGLELTTDQLAEYRRDPAAYFRLYHAGTGTVFNPPDPSRIVPDDAPEELLAAIEFYRLACERDEIFRYRLAGLMKERKVSAAVVVTGGFHKAGFEKELREAGYSYAVVMPKIDSLNGSQMYEPVMRGDFSYKKYLEASFYRAFMSGASVNLVSGLSEPDFKRTLKQWRDDVIRELAARKQIDRAADYTGFIDALTKIYLEKFNDPNPIELRREEVLRAVEDELKDFKKNTVGGMWRTFGAQFKTFVRGLKDLADSKTVTAENVGSLIRKSSAVKPNTLSTVLALANGSESRRIVDAMAGRIDTTVRRQKNPYALASRETYQAAVKGVKAPRELVQRPEIRAEARKLAPVIAAAKGLEVSAGAKTSDVLAGLKTGTKAALEKMGPVNAAPPAVAAAIVEAAKNLSEPLPLEEAQERIARLGRSFRLEMRAGENETPDLGVTGVPSDSVAKTRALLEAIRKTKQTASSDTRYARQLTALESLETALIRALRSFESSGGDRGRFVESLSAVIQSIRGQEAIPQVLAGQLTNRLTGIMDSLRRSPEAAPAVVVQNQSVDLTGKPFSPRTQAEREALEILSSKNAGYSNHMWLPRDRFSDSGLEKESEIPERLRDAYGRAMGWRIASTTRLKEEFSIEKLDVGGATADYHPLWPEPELKEALEGRVGTNRGAELIAYVPAVLRTKRAGWFRSVETREELSANEVIRDYEGNDRLIALAVFMPCSDEFGRENAMSHYFFLPESFFLEIKDALSRHPSLIYEAIRAKVPILAKKFESWQKGQKHLTSWEEYYGEPTLLGPAGRVETLTPIGQDSATVKAFADKIKPRAELRSGELLEYVAMGIGTYFVLNAALRTAGVRARAWKADWDAGWLVKVKNEIDRDLAAGREPKRTGWWRYRETLSEILKLAERYRPVFEKTLTGGMSTLDEQNGVKAYQAAQDAFESYLKTIPFYAQNYLDARKSDLLPLRSGEYWDQLNRLLESFDGVGDDRFIQTARQALEKSILQFENIRKQEPELLAALQTARKSLSVRSELRLSDYQIKREAIEGPEYWDRNFPGRSVRLDIGTGSGYNAMKIARGAAAALIVGVDLPPGSALTEARTLAGDRAMLLQSEIPPLENLKFIETDARELLANGFRENQVDEMYLFFPYTDQRVVGDQFLKPDESGFWDLAVSRLKPGGTLHLITESTDYTQRLGRYLEENHASAVTWNAKPLEERPAEFPGAFQPSHARFATVAQVYLTVTKNRSDVLSRLEMRAQTGTIEGMPLENPVPVAKGPITDISLIAAAVKNKSETVKVNGTTVYFDNDLLDQFTAAGFKTRKEFLEFLNKLVQGELSLNPVASKEIVLTLLDGAGNLIEDHRGRGFIGVHRSLFEKLSGLPKTARALLTIGLRHGLAHESFSMERKVLAEHFQKTRQVKFGEAARLAEQFIRDHATDLKSALQAEGLWETVEGRLLERDLESAEGFALDAGQLIGRKLLPATAPFVERYLREGRSAFSLALEDNLEVEAAKHGFVEPSHPVYRQINGLFGKVVRAAGLEGENIRLYLINSDEVNAYWVTDSRSFFVSLGFVKAFRRYLAEQNLELTQDAIQFVLAHEIRHLVQHLVSKDRLAETESKDRRAITRNREYDADMGGIFLASYAGANPRAAIACLRFLDALGGIPFLTDHPLGDERVGEVQKILQSPDQFLPNIQKEEEVFPQEFLADPLTREPTRAAAFYEKLMAAGSLDDIAEQIDAIEDPALLEEFLDYYYLNMAFRFSSGLMQDPSFRRHMAFLLVANNLSQIINEIGMSSKVSNPQYVFDHEWKVPTTIAPLFRSFQTGQKAETMPPVLVLGPSLAESQKAILDYLEKAIQESISNLQDAEGDWKKEHHLPILQALEKNLRAILNEALTADAGAASVSHGEDKRFVAEKDFPSLAAAKAELGEMFISSRERRDGVVATYLDRNALLTNFEGFWKFFENLYDRTTVERWQSRGKQAEGIRMLGLKEWFRKGWGKMELPKILFELEVDQFGDFDDARKAEVGRGRAQFLEIYMRFLAFRFFLDSLGPYAAKPAQAPPAVPHMERISAKIKETIERQYGDKLGAGGLKLTMLVRYEAIFRNQISDYDERLERLIHFLSVGELETVSHILMTQPPYQLSSMPAPVAGMVEYGNYFGEIQKRFVSHYFEVLQKILARKAAEGGLGLEDIGRLVTLRDKFTLRFGNDASQSEGFKKALVFVFESLLVDRGKESLDLIFGEIGATGDTALKDLLFKYLNETYFAADDYQPRIDALVRLYPTRSEARNQHVEAIFKMMKNYETWTDAAKKEFLERLLPQFETDARGLYHTDEEDKALHQKLSRDYMLILKKEGMDLGAMIRRMDEVGAIPVLFDLIAHNYDEWRNLSFENARKIVVFIKQSKSGYKSYQMVIGAAALSKSVPGFPTFYRTPDTSGDNAVRTMPDGSRKRVNAYEYELKQKGDFKDFHGYLSNLIRGKDSLPFLAGRSFEAMVALIVELIPVSEERDTLLRNLYQLMKPSAAEAPMVLQGFSPLQDKGEMVNLAPTGGGYVNDYMIFAYLGIRDVLRQVGGRKDSPEEVDRAYDIDRIMATIRSRVPDHLKGEPKVQQALTRLETNLKAHHAELKKAVKIPHDTTQFGWQESIRKEIVEFAFANLIVSNPAFDYFNLRAFGYSHDKNFEVIWKIYLTKKAYFFDESIPLKQRLEELVRLFPERTPLRDNLLWNLGAMEESRLAGVPHWQKIVFLNMLSLDYEPFEIIEPEGLDFGRLTAGQARQLIEFYKKMMPHFTEGSRQIVLGRKIYELEKRYFPGLFSDFDTGLREILAIFPKFSLARDSILNEFTAGGAVKTYPQLLEVRKSILEEQRLATEKEIVRDSRWDDLWKLAQAVASREEKADLVLWLLNPSRPLPESLRKLANSQHVNFDSLPGLVFSLTRGEREKFFYDALRGRNGLFEVETLSDEEIAGIQDRLLAEKDEILKEVLRRNPKADRPKLEEAFRQFGREQSFEALSNLMGLLAKEAGEAEPRSLLSEALDMVNDHRGIGMGMIDNLLKGVAPHIPQINKIAGEVDHIQDVLGQLEALLKVSTKLGVGKTLQANIARIREVASKVESLRPIAGEVAQALEALRGINPGQVESMQMLASLLQEKMQRLKKLNVDKEKEEAKVLLREMTDLFGQLDAMRAEIDTLKKALAIIERIGFFRGSAEKLEQLDQLLAMAGDPAIREFVGKVREIIGRLSGEGGLNTLAVVQKTRAQVGQQLVLDRFADGLFEDIFKGDDLGRGREILKDAFKSIFMGYSTERRILMFNALTNVFSSEENRSASRAVKIRIMLEQMGVAGVKVAQFLSEQDPLFKDAPDIQDALRDLKKDAASFHLRAVFQLLQEAGLLDGVVSLGERLGAASIKMVYELFLKNELNADQIDRVAAKFLRPAAEKFLAEDIAVLDRAVRRLNEKYPDLGLPASMVEDIRKMILEELKFEREAANARKFQAHLDARAPPAEGEFRIRVPKIIHQSDYVILEEIVQGITLEDLILLRSDPATLSRENREKQVRLQDRLPPEDYRAYMDYDLEAIHKAIGREFFQEAFGERFFHADLHFGNAMITPNREIYMIDLGAVGQMDEKAMQGMLKLTVALATGNASMGLSLLDTMLEKRTSSSRGVQGAIRDLISSDLAMDDKLNQLIQLIQKNNLGAHPNLVVYLKALAAVAPSLEHLSEEEKAALVRRYLSASSKWSVGWNSLISKLFAGKSKIGKVERPEVRSELRSGVEKPTAQTESLLPRSSAELAERIKKYDADVSDQEVTVGDMPGLSAGAAVAQIKNLRNRSYQDRVLQKEVRISLEDGRGVRGRLFVVLDGYNGNAEIAQIIQHLTLDEGFFEQALLRAGGDAREAIRSYVGEIENHAIRYNHDRYLQGRVPGTTVSLAFVAAEPDGKIKVDTGVLGDSPLLIFGPVDGLGTRAEIYRGPKHSVGSRLFESIGGRIQTAGERSSVPATDSRIVDGNSVLILASDGVVRKGPDVVLATTPLKYSDSQVSLIREAVHRAGEPKGIAGNIVQSARSLGHRDDITAVVVRLDGDLLVPTGPGPTTGRAELRAGKDLRPNRRDFLRIGTALMTSGLLSAAGCVVSDGKWRPQGKLMRREVGPDSLVEWYQDKDGAVTVFITDEVRQAQPLLDELRRIIQIESLRGGPVARAVGEQMRKLADNPAVKLIDKMQGNYDVANFILSSLADKDSLLRQAAAFALVAASAQNPVAAAAILAVLDIALQDGGLEDLWSEGNVRQILAKVLKAYLRTQKLDQLAPLADIMANPEAADAILKSMMRLNPEQLKRLSRSLEKLLARNGVDYERMRRKVEDLEKPAERVLEILDPDFRGLPKLPATSDVLEGILNQVSPAGPEARGELRGLSVAGDLSGFQKSVGDLAKAASIDPQAPQGKFFVIFSGFGKVTDAGMKADLFDQFIDSVRRHRLGEWTRDTSSLNYYGAGETDLTSALVRSDYFQSATFEQLVRELTGLDWAGLDPALQLQFKEIHRRIRASAEQNIREAIRSYETGKLASRKIKTPAVKRFLFKAENEVRDTLVAVVVSVTLSTAFFNLQQTFFAAAAGGIVGVAVAFFMRVIRQKIKDLLRPLRRRIEAGLRIQENLYQKALRNYILGLDENRFARERRAYEDDAERIAEDLRGRLAKNKGLAGLHQQIKQMGPRSAVRDEAAYLRLEEKIVSSEAEIDGQIRLLQEVFRLAREVFGDRLWNPKDSGSVFKITQMMATVKALIAREPEWSSVEPVCLSLLAMMMDARFPLAENDQKISELMDRRIAKLKAEAPVNFLAGNRLDALFRQVREFSAARHKADFVASELAPAKGSAWENLPWLESFRLRQMSLPEKIKYQSDFLRKVRQFVLGKTPQEALNILLGYSSADLFNLANLRARMEGGHALVATLDMNGDTVFPVYAERVITIARQWKAVVFQELLGRDEFQSIKPDLERWIGLIDRETEAIEKTREASVSSRQELRNFEEGVGIFLQASERTLRYLEERLQDAASLSEEDSETLRDLVERLEEFSGQVGKFDLAHPNAQFLAQRHFVFEGSPILQAFYLNREIVGEENLKDLAVAMGQVLEIGNEEGNEALQLAFPVNAKPVLALFGEIFPSATGEEEPAGLRIESLDRRSDKERGPYLALNVPVFENAEKKISYGIYLYGSEVGGKRYTLLTEQTESPSQPDTRLLRSYFVYLGDRFGEDDISLKTTKVFYRDGEVARVEKPMGPAADVSFTNGGKLPAGFESLEGVRAAYADDLKILAARLREIAKHAESYGGFLGDEKIDTVSRLETLADRFDQLIPKQPRAEARNRDEEVSTALLRYWDRQGELTALSLIHLDEKALVEALSQGKVIALRIDPEALTGDLATDFALIHNKIHALEYPLQMAFVAPAGMQNIRTFGDAVSFPVREALKNAFVHGNKLDFKRPFYLQFQLSGEQSGRRPVVMAIRVSDTASAVDVAAPVMALAKQKQLTGEGRAFLWTDFIGWSEQILPIEDSRYGRIGTEVVFSPRQHRRGAKDIKAVESAGFRAELRGDKTTPAFKEGDDAWRKVKTAFIASLQDPAIERSEEDSSRYLEGLAGVSAHGFGVRSSLRKILSALLDDKVRYMSTDELRLLGLIDAKNFRVLKMRQSFEKQEGYRQGIFFAGLQLDPNDTDYYGPDFALISEEFVRTKQFNSAGSKLLPDIPLEETIFAVSVEGKKSLRRMLTNASKKGLLNRREVDRRMARVFSYQELEGITPQNLQTLIKTGGKKNAGKIPQRSAVKNSRLTIADFSVGDRVDHPLFGHGTVLRKNLSNGFLTVVFDRDRGSAEPEKMTGTERMTLLSKGPETETNERQEMRSAESESRGSETEISAQNVRLASRAEREEALVRTLGSALYLLSKDETLKDTLPSYADLDTHSLREVAKIIVASHNAEHLLGDRLEFILAIPPEQYQALLKNPPSVRLLSLDTAGRAYQAALDRGGALPLKEIVLRAGMAGQPSPKLSLLDAINQSLKQYGISALSDFDSHEFSAEKWILLGLRWGLLSLTSPSGSSWFGLFDADGKAGVYAKGYFSEFVGADLGQSLLGHTHGIYDPNYLFGPSPSDIEAVMTKAIQTAERSPVQTAAQGFRKNYSEFILTEQPGSRPSFDLRILRVDMEGASRDQGAVKLSQYVYGESGWREDRESLLENKGDLPPEFFEPVPFSEMQKKLTEMSLEGGESLGREHEQAVQEALPIVVAERNGDLFMSISLMPLVYSYGGGEEAEKRSEMREEQRAEGGKPADSVILPPAAFQLPTYLNAPVVVEIFNRDGKQGLKVYLADVWARALTDRNRLLTGIDQLAGDLHELKTPQLFDAPTLQGAIGKRLESPYGDMFGNQLSESISRAALMALVFGLGVRTVPGTAGTGSLNLSRNVPGPLEKVRQALTLLDHPDILAKAYLEKFGKPLVIRDQSQLVTHSGLLDDQYELMKQAMLSIASRVGIMTPVGTEIKLNELVKMAPDIFQLMPLRPGVPVTPSMLARKGFNVKSGRIVMWVETGVPFDFSSNPELGARLRDSSFAVQNDVARAMAEHEMSPSEKVGLLTLFEAEEFRGKLQEVPGSVFLVMTMDTFEAGLGMLLELWHTEAAGQLRVKAAA